MLIALEPFRAGSTQDSANINSGPRGDGLHQQICLKMLISICAVSIDDALTAAEAKGVQLSYLILS
jgi:3-hydroxyisobutyrate dehydrogenase-like beta-hydroxyacid dehydrogenase